MTHPAHATGGDPRADAFDARARALHQQSVRALSEDTQVALQRARHAAARHSTATPTARPHGTARAWQWPVTAGAFAVAVAAVLLVPLPGANDPSTIGAPMVAAQDAPDTAETLDENPDLYLWLASNDAVAFASE